MRRILNSVLSVKREFSFTSFPSFSSNQNNTVCGATTINSAADASLRMSKVSISLKLMSEEAFHKHLLQAAHHQLHITAHCYR